MRVLSLLSLVAVASSTCNFLACMTSPGSFCIGGVDGTCTDLSAFISIATSLGLDFTAWNTSATANLAVGAQLVADGQLQNVAAGAWGDVTFGTATSVRAALAVQASAQVTIKSITAAAINSYIAVEAAANATFQAATVAANQALTIGLSASSNTMASIEGLTLNAGSSLVLSGAGYVEIDSTTSASGSSITANGGVMLEGNINSAILKITASGQATATASVTGAFMTSGAIQGTGTLSVESTGTLTVSGTASTAVSAAIDIKASGKAKLTRVASSAAVSIAGSLDVSGSTSFATVNSCTSGATVTYEVSALASSGTIFTYTSLGVSGTTVPPCAVMLKDSTGATVTLTASRGSSRRASSGTANWGSNSLTYNNGGGSPAARETVSFGVLVALVAAVFAFRP